MSLFWKKRDYEVLVERLNRELIDDIIGTYITIFRISPDQTEVNMYGESAISTGKVYDNGVNVPAIITHDDLTFETNEFGPASDQVVTFAFQRNYLLEVDFRPEIGDIVEWSIWNAAEDEWNLKYGVVSSIKNEIRGNRLVSVSKVIPLNDPSAEIDFFTLSLRLISQTSDVGNENE